MAPMPPIAPDLLARARAAWPDVDVPDDAFAAWVAERSAGNGEGNGHVEDLYLACACARGDAAALRTFDTAFGKDIETLCQRFRWVPGGSDDVRQLVYEKLFVGESPRIREYLGRGGLRSWLRVLVTRVLLNTTQRDAREVPAADEMFAALPEPSDPETARIRATYGDALRAAFAEALEQLSYRDKNMLRYAIVEHLGIDEIGKIYSVHRATAARWLADAKDALSSELRAAMKARLGVSDSELASIARALQSQLDLTLSGYLGKKK